MNILFFFPFIYIRFGSSDSIVIKVIEDEKEEEVNFKWGSWRESEQNRDRSISSTFDFVLKPKEKKKNRKEKKKYNLCRVKQIRNWNESVNKARYDFLPDEISAVEF